MGSVSGGDLSRVDVRDDAKRNRSQGQQEARWKEVILAGSCGPF